jgi:hypothetical protein
VRLVLGVRVLPRVDGCLVVVAVVARPSLVVEAGATSPGVEPSIGGELVSAAGPSP